MTPKPDQFTLTLQALPSDGGPGAIIRLRRFLKMALRAFRFRCVEITRRNFAAKRAREARGLEKKRDRPLKALDDAA